MLLSKNTWRRVCSGTQWPKLRGGLKNAYNLTSKTKVIPNLSPKFVEETHRKILKVIHKVVNSCVKLSELDYFNVWNLL